MFLASMLLGLSFLHFWQPTASTTVTPAPNTMKQGEFGSLVLCPPGGKTFRMAWSLACEMRRKRRKRRSTGDFLDESETRTNINRVTVGDHDTLRPSLSSDSGDRDARRMAVSKREPMPGYRPATLTDIQQICCNVGCEIRDLLSYCDPFGPWNS